MIGRSVVFVLAAVAAAAAVALRKAGLSNRKPVPPGFLNPTAPPPEARGQRGRWVQVQPQPDGSYRLFAGAVYRASFEVMGAASWFDSESAVKSKALDLGVPLTMAADLGGDRYAVQTQPLPTLVVLSPHPAVQIESVEIWTEAQ